MTTPDDAVVVEAADELHLTEDLITLQVVHDRLDGSAPMLSGLADPHPGPAVCPVTPVPKRPHRVG